MAHDELTFHGFNAQRDREDAALAVAPAAPEAAVAPPDQPPSDPSDETLFDQQRDGQPPG
jgi:hypothetical protein